MTDLLPDDLLHDHQATILAIAGLLIMGGAVAMYTDIGDSTQDDDLDTLRIGYVPSPLNTPHYTAIEEGFYREAGFDAELVQMPGPEIGKALLNGRVEVGSSATTPAAYQRANDLSIRLVAARASFSQDDPGGAYFVARNGTGIQEPEDVRGKTVCLSTAGGMGELWLAMWADEHNMTIGEDFDRTFLGGETQYATALASGSVDACFLDLSHPKYTFLKQDNIAYRFDEMSNPEWVAAYVTVRQEWVEDEPEKLQRFLQAYAKAAEHARENPEERIENTVKYTQYSAETLNETVLPVPPENLTVPTETLTTVQHLMAEHGLVDEEQDMAPIVHNDAIIEAQQSISGDG